MALVDYDDAAAAYARGRPLTLDIAAWCDAVAPYVRPDAVAPYVRPDAVAPYVRPDSGTPAGRRGPAAPPLLDVGAGTGWFAGAFAACFDTAVIAVEPAAGMRRQAAAARADPRVRFVGGTAERLPLRDCCARAAWLSTVIHHVGDLAAAARELARVLVPGAPVLIRSAFPDRLDALTLFRFFPAARQVAAIFPSVAVTAASFASAGFVQEARVAVPQESAPNLAAAAEYARTMRHADSTLRPLSDDEFAAGLAALETAAAAAELPAPVVDHLDLLVFRLPAG